MNNDEILKMYEKTYYHELDYRDKITARLQLPFVVFITLLSFLGYILRSITYNFQSWFLYVILILVIVDAVLISIGIYNFVRAFYGHEYEYMPNATSIETYRKKLKQTYKGFSKESELTKRYFNEFLTKYYSECSTTNATVNDLRSDLIHKANTYIVAVIIPLILTFVIVYSVNVNDKLMNKKANEKSIEVEKIIHINTQIKSNNFRNEN